MRTNVSSAADPVYALSGGVSDAPFSFESVSFSAMQVLQGGE